MRKTNLQKVHNNFLFTYPNGKATSIFHSESARILLSANHLQTDFRFPIAMTNMIDAFLVLQIVLVGMCDNTLILPQTQSVEDLSIVDKQKVAYHLEAFVEISGSKLT